MTLFKSAEHKDTATARPAGFGAGVLLLLLNPKAYVIIALMFTQFVATDNTDHWQLVILITTVFTLNNLCAFLAWTAAGDRLAARFRDETSARRINRVFGIILAIVAIWMFFG